MPGPQNKTVTVTAATAAVSVIHFTLLANNTIQEEVFGTCSETDGSTLANTQKRILSGAADTTIRNYMTGGALTAWRTANGIEAP